MNGKENKTAPGSASVPDFLEAIADEQQRADSRTLIEIMARLTGEEPVIWGSGMIGFGSYHYRYDSGREGDAFLVGFAPRKAEFSIYLTCTYLPETAAESKVLLERLGKHRMGKGCLYVKRLANIDLSVLEQLISASVAGLKRPLWLNAEGRSHRFR